MIKPIFWTYAVAGWSLFLCPAFSQVTPDQTLGNENSIIEQQIQRKLIKGGAVRGSTLFHSLKELSIQKGQQVYFANPSDISIILARVTGGNQSNINGTLGVLGNADLFLMNPSGITFGPDATMNLNGSFIATTGSSFIFENGQIFSATNPQIAPSLRISVPVGIQFDGTSGQIEVNGNSKLISNPKSSRTFALVGDGINTNNTSIIQNKGNIFFISISTGIAQISQQQDRYKLLSHNFDGLSDIKIQNSVLFVQDEVLFIDQASDNSSLNGVFFQSKSLFISSFILFTSFGEGVDIPEIVKKPQKIQKSCRPGQAIGNSSLSTLVGEECH